MGGVDQNKQDELTRAMRKAMENVVRNALIVDGVVVNTDDVESKFVVDVKVLSDGSIFHDVPVKVLIGEQASFIEIPKKDSKCLLCFRDGNNGRPQLFSVNKAEKILIDVDLVQFNGGDLGGLIKIVSLTSKLNNLKTELTTELAKISAAIAALTGTYTPGVLSQFNKSDYENEKIKQ